MRDIKDSKSCLLRIGYDGRVHKRYRGPLAQLRFENEVRILRFLEEKGCTFVPRLLEVHPEERYIITTNCGSVAPSISDEKVQGLFSELETYGVRHEDPFARNVTYSQQLGRFCLIDFEFATILSTGEGLTPEAAEKAYREDLKKEHG